MIVNDDEGLGSFMDHISSQTEIAVDVEHHSDHSFLGHTCILQVSTRTHDFILDWMSLGLKLECLNQVMTNPNVIKVCLFNSELNPGNYS
jgi:exosome complex exonuclease RRP6